MTNQEIQEYIVREFKLEALPPEIQEQSLKRISAIIANKVVFDTYRLLNPKQQEEYESLISNGEVEPDTVANFLQNNLPQYQQILTNALERVKSDYLILTTGKSE